MRYLAGYFILLSCLLTIVSCKNGRNSDRLSAGAEGTGGAGAKAYHLGLDPQPG